MRKLVSLILVVVMALSVTACGGGEPDTRINTPVATSATWESCTLRSWLNSTFIDIVFSQEEQSAIILTSVENSDEKTTQDRIFLLSYDEVWHYYRDESLRQAAGTTYAKANKLFVSEKTGMSAWWLRTAASALYKYVVNPQGLHENSPRVNESEGVRPVLWVDLDLLNKGE